MKRKMTDHSPAPQKKDLVPVPDLVFYHWSPTCKRNSINRRGLVPGSLDIFREWRPPYICFSDEPQLAWQLSGSRIDSIPSWDLWMVNVNHQTSFDSHELIFDTYPNTGRKFIKEYRVYTRIFKRDVFYVATREQE